ncbi:RNA polymerase sigma-I factor [Anoxybacillus amylolyticus]|uniref:RNA polymerase sigma factor SigI n=2 Tax=Anoxybacteroides amylolyticum TaxID=294699 RepID=A0A160F208_9BACL|nr:RNA polymerase sigma-I factor [Anoxybacillus amylolyticus]
MYTFINDDTPIKMARVANMLRKARGEEMLRSFFRKVKDDQIEKFIEQFQNRETEKLNDFIEQYKPFIATKVSEVCKRKIDPEYDDEFSIGLIAFNEAIEKYAPNKGSNFLSFASLVIKRRVIDYIRKEKKNYGYSLDDREEDMENPYEIKVTSEQYQKQIETEQRKEEIFHYTEKLKEFGITILDLTEHSPKHKDARETSLLIAKTILRNENLKKQLFDTKKLPIKEVANLVDVSRKTIERNRKYLIALVILLSEDYIYLKEYLKGVEK